MVTFELSETEHGTLPSPYHGIGLRSNSARPRRHSLQANDGSWTHQTKLIEKYLIVRCNLRAANKGNEDTTIAT